jgi:hypothetical protein
MTQAPPLFDPYAILAALDRRHVRYVVIGAFARVIRGADEMTDGVDVVPSPRPGNLRHLELALHDLGAQRIEGSGLVLLDSAVGQEPVIAFTTEKGELKVVPQPAGTRGGYDDLRRAATREPIGKGLRPSVASIADLARMIAALGRDDDMPKLRALRRLTELERGLDRELSL